MVICKQVNLDSRAEYAQVPMVRRVESILQVAQTGGGLEGVCFTLTEVPVEPYTMDFDEGRSPNRWADSFGFDISHWALFMAYDDGKPVGGCVIAAKTPECRLLDGRDDMALLWELRVAPGYKSRGIGGQLFALGRDWAAAEGYRLLKIECQNTNVPACRFYAKQGARLESLNRHAYGNGEYMLLWYLNL